MAETLDAAAVVAMLDAVAKAIVDQADVLTDADLAIGDGDHGTGMKRGFEAARAALESSPTASIEDAFKSVGMAVLSETGGAAGAIFGTFFRAGGKALSSKELLDGAGFADILESGLAAVLKRGGVTEGQKTIIDALAPAARAARAHGGSLEGASAAAAQGALHGVEATKEMIATTGKARSLGERSLGHPDPGAISVSIILVAMRDFISGN
ncbi:MAG: dihydroxyacetone kinase subunit DhaL [Rhizobiaceae bacterium]